MDRTRHMQGSTAPSAPAQPTEPIPVVAPPPVGNGFNRGRATVTPGPAPRPGRFTPDDTTPDLFETDPRQPQPRAPIGYQARNLRRGGELTAIGAMFAFICWGIWAISARGGDLTVPVFAFVLVLLIAVGVFVLCRLLGRVILERTMGRVRRGARLSHLATGVFLTAAGIAYLGQTEWVVDAWSWLKGLF